MKDFTIFKTPKMKNSIANIRKGEKLTVLLVDYNENYSKYLIKSDLGLLGWTKIKQGLWVDETPIRDLYYHGD